MKLSLRCDGGKSRFRHEGKDDTGGEAIGEWVESKVSWARSGTGA